MEPTATAEKELHTESKEQLPDNVLDLEAIELEATKENDREMEKADYSFSKSRILKTLTPGEGRVPIMVFRVKMGNMSFYVPVIDKETGKQVVFKSPFSGKWDPQFEMHQFHRIEANWAKDGYLSEYYVYNDTPKPVIAKLFQMTNQSSNPVMTKMTHIKKTNYKEYVALVERDQLNKQLDQTNKINTDLQTQINEMRQNGDTAGQKELEDQLKEINGTNEGLTADNKALVDGAVEKDKQLAEMKAKLEALEKDN